MLREEAKDARRKFAVRVTGSPIIGKKLRTWCAQHQITLKDVLNTLTAEGVYCGSVKKRMAKGTKLSAAPAVDAYVFDCAKGEFLDPEVFSQPVEEAEEDAGQ